MEKTIGLFTKIKNLSGINCAFIPAYMKSVFIDKIK